MEGDNSKKVYHELRVNARCASDFYRYYGDVTTSLHYIHIVKYLWARQRDDVLAKSKARQERAKTKKERAVN